MTAEQRAKFYEEYGVTPEEAMEHVSMNDPIPWPKKERSTAFRFTRWFLEGILIAGVCVAAGALAHAVFALFRLGWSLVG